MACHSEERSDPVLAAQDSAKNLVFAKQCSATQTTRFFASAEFILNEVQGFGSE
jgi:hypothetical protein